MNTMVQEYRVPIKAGTLLTVFTGLWGVGAIGMALVIVAGMIDSARYEDGLLFVILILVLFGFFAIKLAWWKVKGFEILQVHTNGLWLKSNGPFFSKHQFIPYHEFDSIDFDADDDTPYWMKLYNLAGGKIKVKYLGRTVRWGQSLTYKGGETLSIDMNETIGRIPKPVAVAETEN